MRLGASPRRDAVERLADIVSSPVLNVLVGVAGVVMPVIVWAGHRKAAAGIALTVETVLLLALVISHLWLRRTHIYLRRPASQSMSDPRYFDVIRSRLEGGTTYNRAESAIRRGALGFFHHAL
jgi:Flp pilus assembly protein TadB